MSCLAFKCKSISLNQFTTEPNPNTYYYSYNQVDWFPVVFEEAITCPDGGMIYFKGTASPAKLTEEKNTILYALRFHTETGPVEISGSVTSLIDNGLGEECLLDEFDSFSCLFYGLNISTYNENLLSNIKNLNPFCFLETFSYSSITSLPRLPWTELADGCYNAMFYECTSLRSANIELPSEDLAVMCYAEMFKRCFNLKTANFNLPAKNPVISLAYQEMFSQCSSLIASPHISLKDASAAFFICQQMFDGCSSLYLIDIDLEKWDGFDMAAWVNNIPSSGTFYCPAALPKEFGVDRIPEGWDVIRKDRNKGTMTFFGNLVTKEV